MLVKTMYSLCFVVLRNSGLSSASVCRLWQMLLFVGFCIRILSWRLQLCLYFYPITCLWIGFLQLPHIKLDSCDLFWYLFVLILTTSFSLTFISLSLSLFLTTSPILSRPFPSPRITITFYATLSVNYFTLSQFAYCSLLYPITQFSTVSSALL